MREHPQNMRVGNMLDDLGDVHNHFLKLEKRYYRIYGKYAGRYRLQPHLTKLLNRTKRHWAWIPRDTLDAVIIRLHLAWEKFFDFLKKGKQGRRVGPRSSKSVRNTALRSFRMPINLSKGVFVSPLKHGTQLRNPSNMLNDGFLSISIAIGRRMSAIFKSVGMLPERIGSMS